MVLLVNVSALRALDEVVMAGRGSQIRADLILLTHSRKWLGTME